MLRNGDFLLLLALIWAAALSGPDPGTRCRAPGQRDPPSTAWPRVLPSLLSTQSTATCLASCSPPSLETLSPGDPG